jgi:hypothetical protein
MSKTFTELTLPIIINLSEILLLQHYNVGTGIARSVKRLCYRFDGEESGFDSQHGQTNFLHNVQYGAGAHSISCIVCAVQNIWV